MKKKIELIMAVCVVFSAFVVAKQSAVFVQSLNTEKKETCIVIDAGHGGSDPGKVGINGAREKDINLTLTKKLCKLLKKERYHIILTRDSDAGLYSDSSPNKKVEDMQNRCKIIEDAHPLFTISLHQNSYPAPEVHGAQVFYYGQSEKGKELAEILQRSLIANVDPNNRRAAKANESYYLLKKTPTPTVIVECGFLSNPTEAELLLSEEYQDKLVNAIYLGIMEYLKENIPEDLPMDNTENVSDIRRTSFSPLPG